MRRENYTWTNGGHLQCGTHFRVESHLTNHFSIVGETLLKHSVQEDGGERRRAVARQLLFAQHAVVVLIQIEILA